MKKTFLAAVLLILWTSGAFAQSYNFNIGGLQFSSGAAVPGSCSPDGRFFFKNTTSKDWYKCVAGAYVGIGTSGGTVTGGPFASGNIVTGGGSQVIQDSAVAFPIPRNKGGTGSDTSALDAGCVQFPCVVFSSITTGQNSVAGAYSTVYTTTVAGIYRLSASVYATTASSAAWAVEIAGQTTENGQVFAPSGFNLAQATIGITAANPSVINPSPALSLAAAQIIQIGTFTASGANTGGVYTYTVVIERLK